MEQNLISENLEAIRRQLITLAGQKKKRVTEWTPEMPTDWRPHQVSNPSSGMPFTGVGAWHFIANLLENAHLIEEIVLHKPPGARAYVMLVELNPEKPKLYIKLQLMGGKVIGRSFHYSTEH